jgi:DNA-binding LacI/PurR family transcriptional regulator
MVGRKPVRIDDVAREAGVSITTVSHALSGKGRLPDETRERVRRVAADLGYAPNPAARSLAGGKVGLIATFVSLPGNAPLAFTEIDYYVQLITAATAAAIERGYSLVVAPSNAGGDTWSRLPLDGAIVIDPASGDPGLRSLRDHGAPLVLIGRDLDGQPDDVVVQNDHAAATRSVLDHLVHAGADHVALLTLEPYESFTADALEAYRSWCAERGREPVVALTPADSTSDLVAFREAADAFVRRPDRPGGVFCMYERLGVEVLRAARDAGMSVPTELRVAAISEMGLAESADPPLTTLEINPDALGARAAHLLMDRVEGRDVSSALAVPTWLVARASTTGQATS